MGVFIAVVGLTLLNFQAPPPVLPKVVPVTIPPALELPAPSNLNLAQLNVDQAVAIALSKQPLLRVAKAQVDQAAGAANSSKGLLVPAVSATTGYSYVFDVNPSPATGGSNSLTTTSTGETIQSSIILKQLLYDFVHSRDLAQQGLSNFKATKKGYQKALIDTAFATRNSFYGLQNAEQLVKVQESNVASRQAQFAYANARLLSGLGAPSDVFTAATGLGDAVTNLVSARQAAIAYRIGLAINLGIDPRTPLKTIDSTEKDLSSLDLTTLVDQAVRSRPDLAQAQFSIQAAQYGLNASRSANSPSISLSLGYNSKGVEEPLTNQTGSVGLSVTWALSDPTVPGKVQQAQAQLEAGKASLDAITQSVISDVSQAYIALQAANQRVLVAAATLEDAKQSVNISEGRFKAGVTTFLEVITNQSSLVTAQVNLTNAQSQVQIARAQLRHAIGGL